MNRSMTHTFDDEFKKKKNINEKINNKESDYLINCISKA